MLIALLAWGNRHFAPEGATTQIVDSKTGKPADPMLVDRATGRALQAPDYRLSAGPAATASTQRRLARGSRLLEARPDGVAP